MLHKAAVTTADGFDMPILDTAPTLQLQRDLSIHRLQIYPTVKSKGGFHDGDNHI
jgi:hypothetical protein